MPSTGPARGMRDFLPEDVRRREYVIGVIADVYRRYGFEPLETPAVENIETLTGKYGEEGDRLIFKILKRGEEGKQTGEADLALRYDLTVPLARVVAEYRGRLPKYFKRYQVQPVWRADRPQRGRFREFYQCDVDAIGAHQMIVEAELCAAVSDVLQALGFHDFVIKLNHRQVLSGIMAVAGVEPAKQGDALIALDKLDKIGAEGVARELAQRGITDVSAGQLLGFFQEIGALSASSPDRAAFNAEALARMQARLASDEGGRAGAAELAEIVALSTSTSAAAHIQIDPSLARGLSYYTGAIFEIAVPDLAGSLGGGGRYDNLVGMFSGDQVPAAGFSLGLERILVVMGERGMFPPSVVATHADVMVTLWNRERVSDALAVASQLRSAGLRVDVYPEPDKLGKQFKYAASRNVPLVVVLGEDEAARGEVGLKDLRSGEQIAVRRAELGAAVRERLGKV